MEPDFIELAKDENLIKKIGPRLPQVSCDSTSAIWSLGAQRVAAGNSMQDIEGEWLELMKNQPFVHPKMVSQPWMLQSMLCWSPNENTHCWLSTAPAPKHVGTRNRAHFEAFH